MSDLIQCTPVYGSADTEPLCYLLEIDDCRILLDCGWNQRFDESSIDALRSVVSDVDLVLLSHADLAHIGALPYAVGRLGLDCPIYATLPVWRMGQMFLYDAFQHMEARTDFDLFTLDDVDATFEKFVKVTYSQETHLSGRGDGITITPYAAGRTLGGAIWKITKETEEIVYAVDINHKKERHLDSTVLESACKRPSVLITDAYNALVQLPPRKERDKEMFSSVLKCLRGGGNVLMPVDSAGRVFELLLCLHQVWVARKLDQEFSFALLSNVGFHIIEFAKSFIEWMSSACQKAFDNSRDSPFALKHVHLCHNMEDLSKLRKPALVLASSNFINCSFAEDLFREWAPDPRNLILFTDKPRHDCLAASLLRLPTPGHIKFERHFKVLLEGEELVEYLEKTREQQASKMDEGEDSESEVDEDDVDMDKDASHREAGAGESAPASGGMFKKKMKLVPLYPMYNFKEEIFRGDLYGELINADDYKVPDDVDVKKEPNGDADIDDVEEEAPEPEAPKKALVAQEDVVVRCQIGFVDIEGRSDGASIKTIVGKVAPRKLVLVHGSNEAKANIRRFCEQKVSECQMVLAPANRQSVSVTADTNIFTIKMRDSLASALQFVRVGDYEVSYVDGQLEDVADSRHLVLHELPPSAVREHAAVFLGDVKMSDVKKALARAGISSYFVSGILVCEGGVVNIRRASRTQISVNGSLCNDYFRIRELLYQQYQII